MLFFLLLILLVICLVQGLTKDNVSGHIRVLQRKIAKLKEQIKACQLGRIDFSIPSRCVYIVFAQYIIILLCLGCALA